MSLTFDGTQKLIICNLGTSSLTAQGLYSAWKQWVQSGQGINYLPAFEAIGGQPLPGGLFAGQTFFLINGWKIKPQEANHRLTIIGNLYTEDGSPITVTVPGYTIEVSLSTSAQAQGISTAGSSITAADVWSYSTRTLTVPVSSLTLSQVESSTVLAKASHISNLQSFITPYLNKVHTVWTAGGHDIENPVTAKAPTSTTPGFVKSLDLAINQIHQQNPNGTFTLSQQGPGR